MKKILIAFVFGLMTQGVSWAQSAKDFGAGMVLGRPIGGTAKYWINDIYAVDGGIGAGSDLTLYSDFVIHGWKMFKQPRQGKLAGHIALGGRMEFEDPDTDFGIRTMFGVDFWVKGQPIELFAELGPVFLVANDHGDDVTLDGGIGFRYYFQGFN